MPAREGTVWFLGVALAAAALFAVALRLRSWPFWLAAFAMTLSALGVAWLFRPHA